MWCIVFVYMTRVWSSIFHCLVFNKQTKITINCNIESQYLYNRNTQLSQYILNRQTSIEIVLNRQISLSAQPYKLSLQFKSWIFSIITPVFSVAWSFRNHSNMLFWWSINISYYFQCWKQLCCLIFFCGNSNILFRIPFKTTTIKNIYLNTWNIKSKY